MIFIFAGVVLCYYCWYYCCADIRLLDRLNMRRGGITHDTVDISKGILVTIRCVDGAIVEVNHVPLCDVALLPQPAPASGPATQQSHSDKAHSFPAVQLIVIPPAPQGSMAKAD